MVISNDRAVFVWLLSIPRSKNKYDDPSMTRAYSNDCSRVIVSVVSPHKHGPTSSEFIQEEVLMEYVDDSFLCPSCSNYSLLTRQ